MMTDCEVRPASEGDREWIVEWMIANWGSRMLVSRGRAHDASDLPTLLAWRDGECVGLATYRVEGDECELVSINSLIQWSGIGSRLIEAVRNAAVSAGCRRLWLITTNDNMAALRFYQRRGFALAAVHPNALAASRRLKPEIPLVGFHGIPLRDEIELEMRLDG